MRSVLVLLFLLSVLISRSQKGGAEHYYYTHQRGEASSVPMLWYGSAKGFYSEVRYNYEDIRTVSLLAGNTFSGAKNGFQYALTPMGGVLWGLSRAATAEVKVEIEKGAFFFSSEPQYALSFEDKEGDFFYNWTEAGINPSPSLFAGLALQHTKVSRTRNQWEPGAFAGFQARNFSIPIYVFNLLRDKRYFVVGLTWEFER